MVTFDNSLIIATNFKGCRFVSLKNYKDALNNLANYLILLGVNLDNLYLKNVESLKSVKFTDLDLELEKIKMINSAKISLNVGIGQHPDYTLKDFYDIRINKNCSHAINGKHYLRNAIVLRKEIVYICKDKTPNIGTVKYKQMIIKNQTGFKTPQTFSFERIKEIRINKEIINNNLIEVPELLTE